MSKKDMDSTTTTGMTRRSFVRAAVSASIAIIGSARKVWSSGAGRAVSPASTGFKVPEAAYVRSLGAVPLGTCSSLGDQQCKTGIPIPGFRELAGGLQVPGLGIPLGGIGAGSFMINQCGTFGPWNMGGQQSSRFWESRTLTQAAFHIREELVGGAGGITVKTLTVTHHNIAPERNFGSVLPSWNQLKPGDGSYASLYPFGFITYKTLQSNASMR